MEVHSTLEISYNLLMYTFNKVIDFVFNGTDMLWSNKHFTFGNLLLVASLAWIVIKFITRSMLNVERETHKEYTSSKYRKDTYSE